MTQANSAPAMATIDVVSRQEFLDEWGASSHYGEHVTFIGPTQRGKTTFAFQLLNRTITPEHKAVILAGKPPGRDHTMETAPRMLNLRQVQEWPPAWSHKDKHNNGYVLKPHHTMVDPEQDNANLRHHFRKAILSNYATTKHPVITVADEGHHVQVDLKLKAECESVLMRGAPQNAMWTLLQRGRFVSYQTYCAPDHIFIFFDPDRDNQRRYADIGGVDPRLLVHIASGLKTYKDEKSGRTISECLYIRRSGPELCIIDIN